MMKPDFKSELLIPWLFIYKNKCVQSGYNNETVSKTEKWKPTQYPLTNL